MQGLFHSNHINYASPQLTALLGDAPTLLNDCLRSSFQPGDMKAVLEHHRKLGHFQEKGVLFCFFST